MGESKNMYQNYRWVTFLSIVSESFYDKWVYKMTQHETVFENIIMAEGWETNPNCPLITAQLKQTMI